MKTLREYIAEYDPYRTDNPRYVPEDQATLEYARVSVIADDRWIGASLQPRHLTWLEARETDFVQGVENDYRHAEKLELIVECYEHKGEGREKRALRGAEFSLFCMGALDIQTVSCERNECFQNPSTDVDMGESILYRSQEVIAGDMEMI